MNDSHDSLFRALVQDRERYVRFAASRLGSVSDAEDAVQGALERAYQKLGQVQDVGALHGWFLTLLRRVVVDTMRREGRRNDRSVPFEDAYLEDACAEEGSDLEDHSVCDCGVSVMRELSPDHIQVLERIVVGEEPIQDVADDLNMTPNATRVRLHRARRALRSQVEAHCGVTSLRETYDCTCEAC